VGILLDFSVAALFTAAVAARSGAGTPSSPNRGLTVDRALNDPAGLGFSQSRALFAAVLNSHLQVPNAALDAVATSLGATAPRAPLAYHAIDGACNRTAYASMSQLRASDAAANSSNDHRLGTSLGSAATSRGALRKERPIGSQAVKGAGLGVADTHLEIRAV